MLKPVLNAFVIAEFTSELPNDRPCRADARLLVPVPIPVPVPVPELVPVPMPVPELVPVPKSSD